MGEGNDWGEHRLMVLDRLSRIESILTRIEAKQEDNHGSHEARIASLEREQSNMKGRAAAWSTVFGFAAGIAAAVIKEVLFK